MTKPLNISVDYQHTEFTPGDTISGRVEWQATGETREVSLRLLWQTTSEGDDEVDIVYEIDWDASQNGADFAIELPELPYSLTSKLTNLQWLLEVVMLPEETSIQYPFTLSPDGKLVQLDEVHDSAVEPKRSKIFSASSNKMFDKKIN